MAMAVDKVFQHLIQKLYESGLHFYLSETPFSAQISIRKKMLKDRAVSSLTVATSEDEEIIRLKDQIIKFHKEVENSNEVINILENKVAHAEAKAFKAYEEKKMEVETLKNTLKKCNHEVSKLKKDLETEHKVVKDKEMQLSKFNKKCENLTLNIKNVKNEMNKVKNENKKLLKSRSKLLPNSDYVPISVTDNPDIETDLNENIPSDLKLPSCSSSSTVTPHPNTPPRVARTSLREKDLCPPLPVTPPRASPCSPPVATGGPACSHSPQCIIRHPKPPPPEKCTILVHDGSKYHEHMESQSGLPYQLGRTHEYCLRIDYENYGCEDCIWYKKWGALHGYPDIHPWTFQEHRQPLTFL